MQSMLLQASGVKLVCLDSCGDRLRWQRLSGFMRLFHFCWLVHAFAAAVVDQSQVKLLRLGKKVFGNSVTGRS